MQAATVDALTINEASETTGWSPRMLRYIESIGLVEPGRSGAGYRLYGPAELQRLSTLRELLGEWGLDLGEVGFALRLEREPELRAAIERWLAAEPARPEHINADAWLRFEQEKHQRLLAESAARARERPIDVGTGTDTYAAAGTGIDGDTDTGDGIDADTDLGFDTDTGTGIDTDTDLGFDTDAGTGIDADTDPPTRAAAPASSQSLTPTMEIA